METKQYVKHVRIYLPDWRRSGAFDMNLEQFSYMFVVFLQSSSWTSECCPGCQKKLTRQFLEIHTGI